MQREAIDAWVAERGAEVEWFPEPPGASGGDEDRRVFNDMMNKALVPVPKRPWVRDKARYDAIVVYMSDRLARDATVMADLLAGCSRAGVQVWSTSEGRLDFGSGDASDRLVSHLKAAVKGHGGEEERNKIRTRTRDGVRRAIASGKVWGGAPVRPGVKGYRQTTDEQEAEALRLRGEGWSITRLRAKYGVGKYAVRAMLERAERRKGTAA